MYDIIKQIIGHTWQTGSGAPGDQQTVYYICGVLIAVLTAVLVDLVYRTFRHFWRR